MTVDVSDEDIFAAADAILASGRNATPARVRAHLGRGNPLRIGALLDQWWAQLLGRLRQDTLPATLTQALGLLWEQATAQGRQDAEQAFAYQRDAWVEDRRVMEKAFAKQRQVLEHRLTKERQVFAEERQRLLGRNELMRERLRQSREAAKEAKVAVRVAQKNLDQTMRQLAFAQAVDAQHHRHDHEQAVELHAVYSELLSRPLSDAEPSGITASAPGGTGGNLWRDFMPLLDAAQRALGQRLDELHRQISPEHAGPGNALSPTQRDTCLGQLRVVEHLLDELRHQGMVYRRAVAALDDRYFPLCLEVKQKLGDLTPFR
jgi:small-conductance mechanosensitive channel